MAKSPSGYEIPAEMRDLAEKSVEQAKTAFDGFIGAANKAVAAVDTQTTTAQHQSRDLAKRAMGYAEQNVTAAFDLAQRLLHAKDVQEVVHIQTEFVKTQVSSLQAQMTEFGSTVQASAKKVAETAQATVEGAAAEIRKAASTVKSK
jgi:phasin